MITLIDYGAGNLKSVENAFHHVKVPVIVGNTPEDVQKASVLVLPGVGAFGACMNELSRLGLVEPIKAHIAAGKPFLGICVGMQVLFESSEESPGVPGLGIFEGKVKKFRAPDIRVPHMGWNQVEIKSDVARFFSRPFSWFSFIRNIFFYGKKEPNPMVYFLHSFYVESAPSDVISATGDYGVKFVAAVQTPTLLATQFHPEKSGKTGLQILQNFAEYFS